MLKPKILIVGAFPPPNRKIFGGIVTSCQSLLDSSFASEFDLILVDSTQISNPPPRLTVRSYLAVCRVLIFIHKLFVSRPDALILFTSAGASVLEKGAMSWIGRLFRIPVLIFPRGTRLIDNFSQSKINKFLILSALKGATHFLCQGPTWKRFATDKVGFPNLRAPIIPNWTATNSLLSIGKNRDLSADKSIIQIVFVGWLEITKGIFELLESVNYLSQRHNFKLVIAGRGHAEDKAKLYVAEHGISDVVTFSGWLQGSDLHNLLAESDVFVLPSWSEGFPNAMIEAMAAKLAVVVSRVGNVPDVITDKKQALLIEPKDVTGLSYAIESLLIDRQLRLSIAESGFRFVEENFSVELAVSKLIQAVKIAIDESKSGANQPQ